MPCRFVLQKVSLLAVCAGFTDLSKLMVCTAETKKNRIDVDDEPSGDTHRSTLKHSTDDDFISPTQDIQDAPARKNGEHVSGEATSMNIPI
jgi:hypothetical protein